MSFLSDVALAEVGSTEIALDGILYADIESAASASFTADASVGLAVYAVASANLGTTEDDHISRVVTQPATSSFHFTPDALGQTLIQFSPAENILWTGGSSMGPAVYSEGSASWSWTADAQVQNDEVYGIATWLWANNAVGQLHANSVGVDTLRFDAAPDIQAVFSAVGSDTLPWTGSARVNRVQSEDAADFLRFTATALPRPLVWLDAAAAWAFAASGRLQAWRYAVGTDTLRFSAAGAMDSKNIWLATALATPRFTGLASANPIQGINASASFGFTSAARMLLVKTFGGTATLRFNPVGVPGAPIYTHLALAREGFVVPPAGDAWSVTPDPELEDV